MANDFKLNRGALVAWSAQIKAQKGVMLEPQVRKSGEGFKVVHQMPLASLLHGLLWKISKGYRNNCIEERHAYLNVLEDQLRESYGAVKKYSDNGHRLANPGGTRGEDETTGSVNRPPHLPSSCYKLHEDDEGPSPALFDRIRCARENASVNRKAYMTSLHEVFLGIASKEPYEVAGDVGSFKQEWRKPEGETNNTRLAEACRRETVAYETKREKAFGGAFIPETLDVLPPNVARDAPADYDGQTQDRIYEDLENLQQTAAGYVETPDRTQPRRQAPPPPTGEERAPAPPQPYDGRGSRYRGRTHRPVTPHEAPRAEVPRPQSTESVVSGEDQAADPENLEASLVRSGSSDNPERATDTQEAKDESIKNANHTSL